VIIKQSNIEISLLSGDI